MANHNKLGIKGEAIAVEYLQNRGYKILETNWRYEKKEIDIIAQQGSFIVIVEVKTRSTDFFGRPEEAVTVAKQKHLIEAADYYLQQLSFEAEVRYDIVSVIKDETQMSIKHIEEAFIPEMD